ncbi:MAG TPA: extracellular solute-binding protein [Stellaceae bacterium]|nr:extracellular solute-binding protein [Stellaceae bacterium]
MAGAVAVSCGAAGLTKAAAGSQTLTIYAAGTLAGAFHAVDTAFEKANPGATVEPQFGGSVMMARRIVDLHQQADIIAVADYSVIPKYLFGQNGKPRLADWYVGFARNAITFVYTPNSKGASDLATHKWYDVLGQPGVEIGRSNPDTDPSGYQTLQMLSLAENYYKVPGLAARILANAPARNIRDTETELIAALQLGQIDYLAIYRSDAVQHHLEAIELPPEINLADPKRAASYAAAIAHTKNGDLRGKPIVYAATIPKSAANAALAAKYLALLLGGEGQAVIARDGFGTMTPALAVNPQQTPAALRALVQPWPTNRAGAL